MTDSEDRLEGPDVGPPDPAHVSVYLDDAVLGLLHELRRLDSDQRVIAEARRRIEAAIELLDPGAAAVPTESCPPAPATSPPDARPEPPRADPPPPPDWPHTDQKPPDRSARHGEEWLDVMVECPVVDCGTNRPMKGHGLRTHLSITHQLSGARPAVKARRADLLALAVDIANGVAAPGKEPLWPAPSSTDPPVPENDAPVPEPPAPLETEPDPEPPAPLEPTEHRGPVAPPEPAAPESDGGLPSMMPCPHGRFVEPQKPACPFGTWETDDLAAHLLEHPLLRGDDSDDVEFRFDCIRWALTEAGLPAVYPQAAAS